MSNFLPVDDYFYQTDRTVKDGNNSYLSIIQVNERYSFLNLSCSPVTLSFSRTLFTRLMWQPADV